MDQALFLETLKAIVTVAKTENNYMTQEQVKKYMKDSGLELEEDKFAFIYQYLGENGVAVEGFDFKPVKRQQKDAGETEECSDERDSGEWHSQDRENGSSASGLEAYVTGRKRMVTGNEKSSNNKNYDIDIMADHKEEDVTAKMENINMEEREIFREDSVYLKMYLSDLEEIPALSENEKLTLWTEMKNGNEAAQIQLMNGCFHEVVNIVKEYRNKGVNLEDLIQEGNMALLQSFDSIREFSTMEQVNGYLKDSVREAIEHLIDMEVNDSDWENTVLAKINLIHEAAKHLAKELGRAATVKELAEYTRMTEEEIEDVKQLSKDVL